MSQKPATTKGLETKLGEAGPGSQRSNRDDNDVAAWLMNRALVHIGEGDRFLGRWVHIAGLAHAINVGEVTAERITVATGEAVIAMGIASRFPEQWAGLNEHLDELLPSYLDRPILLIRGHDKKLVLADGARRVSLARRLGRPELPALVVSRDFLEPFVIDPASEEGYPELWLNQTKAGDDNKRFVRHPESQLPGARKVNRDGSRGRFEGRVYFCRFQFETAGTSKSGQLRMYSARLSWSRRTIRDALASVIDMRLQIDRMMGSNRTNAYEALQEVLEDPNSFLRSVQLDEKLRRELPGARTMFRPMKLARERRISANGLDIDPADYAIVRSNPGFIQKMTLDLAGVEQNIKLLLKASLRAKEQSRANLAIRRKMARNIRLNEEEYKGLVFGIVPESSQNRLEPEEQVRLAVLADLNPADLWAQDMRLFSGFEWARMAGRAGRGDAWSVGPEMSEPAMRYLEDDKIDRARDEFDVFWRHIESYVAAAGENMASLARRSLESNKEVNSTEK